MLGDAAGGTDDDGSAIRNHAAVNGFAVLECEDAAFKAMGNVERWLDDGADQGGPDADAARRVVVVLVLFPL